MADGGRRSSAQRQRRPIPPTNSQAASDLAANPVNVSDFGCLHLTPPDKNKHGLVFNAVSRACQEKADETMSVGVAQERCLPPRPLRCERSRNADRSRFASRSATPGLQHSDIPHILRVARLRLSREGSIPDSRRCESPNKPEPARRRCRPRGPPRPGTAGRVPDTAPSRAWSRSSRAASASGVWSLHILARSSCHAAAA